MTVRKPEKDSSTSSTKVSRMMAEVGVRVTTAQQAPRPSEMICPRIRGGGRGGVAVHVEKGVIKSQV